MVTVGLASHWPRVKTVVLHQRAQDLEDGDEHPHALLEHGWLYLYLYYVLQMLRCTHMWSGTLWCY